MNPLAGTLANAGQKNSRFFYYVRHLLQCVLPAGPCRRRLDGLLRAVPPGKEADIHKRVDYCNKVSAPFPAAEIDDPFRCTLRRGKRNFYLDFYEYARYFDPAWKVRYRFGDKTFVPDRPTIVKARPIAGDNANSVLFKLDKIRHFVFVADPLPYARKRDQLVWRGNAAQPHRRRFLERYFRHPRCDVGHAHKRKTEHPWAKGYLSIAEQLQSKFVLALEGNDVASNLKWVMASNSLCFMPRPRFETWFLEGWLVPGRHYVALQDDFADLDEKMDYYLAHPADALEIIRNAQAHAAMFRNEARERLVALLVLKKYFALSGQWPAAAVRD